MARARLVPRLPIATAALMTALLLAAHSPSAASVVTSLLTQSWGADGDVFGASLASAGDVNADGYDDIVIGAFRYPGGAGQGQAYLFFGGPGIDEAADLVLDPPTGGTGFFGFSVASAGDFNGDGYADVIVGARGAVASGQAFIYYGGPSLDATPDFTLIGETTGSWFGNSVAPAGDVNGDGFDDVIVGAPMYGASLSQVGRAYVFFGGSSPDAVPDKVFTGAAANSQVGWVVGGAGDMNGDGYSDVLATAPRYYTAGPNPGAAYVWFGGPAFDTVADLTIGGSVLIDRIVEAANAGDVNADGFSDLIIARQDRAQVFFGGPNPNAVPNFTFTGSFSVAGAADVNGDGADDFVLGAPGDDTGGPDAGRVAVYFGGSAVDAVEDMHLVDDRINGHFGRGVALARKIDGPGPADLLVAAAQFDPEEMGYDAGRVYMYANSFETTDVPVTPASGLEFVGPWPNPAGKDVNLVLELDHAVPVRVTVYDIAGHEVARPVADEWLVGRVTRTWRPQALPSGVYYIRARLGEHVQVRKLVWLGQRR